MHNDFEQKKALLAYLQTRITPEKLEKMASVIQHRTQHVTVLLENIYQDQNASAIVRSLECFGVQDVHMVQNKCAFNVTEGIAKGASSWISMHNHKTTQDAYLALKKQGYRIVATAPAADNAYTLETLPLDSKCVLVFGTERQGLTQAALEQADEFVTIPMYGFTQSFNVSVTAGICMYYITSKLRASSIDWRLTPEQEVDIQLSWLRPLIRGSDAHERLFLETYNK